MGRGGFLIGSDPISGLCGSSVIAIEWNDFGRRRQMFWQITGATGGQSRMPAPAALKEMGTLPDWQNDRETMRPRSVNTWCVTEPQAGPTWSFFSFSLSLSPSADLHTRRVSTTRSTASQSCAPGPNYPVLLFVQPPRTSHSGSCCCCSFFMFPSFPFVPLAQAQVERKGNWET